MEAFDHAWSLLKAAGRMSPVGDSKESQPVGRYLDRTKGGPPMEQWRSPAEGEKKVGVNPREMLEEAEPPTEYPEGHEFDTEDSHLYPNEGSTRLQEEMMRDLESQGDGPPVSSGYGQVPIEQKVEHARGYVPEGEYAGPAPRGGGGAIRYESDSSVGQGWRDFDKERNPLEPQLDPQTWTSPTANYEYRNALLQAEKKQQEEQRLRSALGPHYEQLRDLFE